MVETGLVPRLRFPEFRGTGGWERRQIGELMVVTSSKRVHETDWTDHGVPFYRAREIVALSKLEPILPLFISEALYEENVNLTGSIVDGHLLVTGVGSIGVPYLVRKGDRFYFKDGNIIWLKNMGDRIAGPFLFRLFETNVVQNQIRKMAGVGTVGTFTIDGAKRTTVTYPSNLLEQHKIAACLTSLDELIAAETKTLDTLKVYKKGLMQQLFPQQGETVPRLRFPEFRGAGESGFRLLGEISKVTTGDKDTQDKKDGGIYPFFVRSQALERIDSFAYDGEAILTSGDGVGVGENFHYINGKFNFHQRVYCIYGFDLGVHGRYLFYYFAARFGKRVKEMSAKNSVDSVRMPMITEMPIWLPTKGEQEAISRLLSTLDQRIAAQAQKIDALKTHKKGLMQGLFPTVPGDAD